MHRDSRRWSDFGNRSTLGFTRIFSLIMAWLSISYRRSIGAGGASSLVQTFCCLVCALRLRKNGFPTRNHLGRAWMRVGTRHADRNRSHEAATLAYNRCVAVASHSSIGSGSESPFVWNNTMFVPGGLERCATSLRASVNSRQQAHFGHRVWPRRQRRK